MKIKRITIKNFRGLNGGENCIDFNESDIIFLIGKNNAGKSSYLAAYKFFVDPKKVARLEDFYNHDEHNNIEIEAIYTVTPNVDSKDTGLNKADPDWIKKWVTSESEIRIRKIWRASGSEGQKQTYDPLAKEYKDGGFGGFDTLLKKYSPEAIDIMAVLTIEELEKNINDIISKNHIKKLQTDYSDVYDELMKKIQQLKNDISNADDITELNDKMNIFFSEVFSKFKLSVYPIPEEGTDLSKMLKSTHGLKVQEDEKTNLNIDLKMNGHGLIRQAFFSFLSTYQTKIEAISGKEKQYLILFEEPELYMHPEAILSLRKQLYALAKNSPYQLLCATHSPMMIDLNEHHASLVRLVKDDNTGKTKTYQVHFNAFSDDDKEKLQMVNRFNPHICESFFTDSVILVEGDTEAVIYRELINKYYTPNKYFVLNTGSKANIPFYQKILTHFGINHVIVHDCDKKTTKTGNTNPMFTLNNTIWEQIEESNRKYPNIARRFVHYLNFEEAHNYKHDDAKGKPLSAFQFATSITKDEKYPCIKFLNDLFTANSINISQSELLNLYNES
ncbi:AAA family ATPase [Treponema sp. OMZ 792]|uniref:ATP-dependent nuclease n=1 Tax=unclassified Treponema TaxID=2638727 RepID=UPI0020A3FCFB|nr:MULTISPECIES: AAA family ATPase [unclassified Treponema]UTC76130.1 AAA family ATPase [Treponema sp. OMZ 792]UTC80132.1 ATP-dependent endonuclease [Treponema sp. OMZ 798]